MSKRYRWAVIFFALCIAQLSLGYRPRVPRPAIADEAHGQWTAFNDCTYRENRANDGDSFHVIAGGRELIFRLYFVDAPETGLQVKSRVHEQEEYFATNEIQTLAAGKLAEAFTREKLSQPFTVRTCFQDALGRSRMERFYAFIQTKSGDLAEQLIENGLARIHGASANPVGLPRANVEWQKLRVLEAAAKNEKVGAWGANAGRLYVRSEKSQSRPALDPFDAFFHPEKAPANGTPDERRPSGVATMQVPPTSPVNEKLNVNTANESQLVELSGIGPVLAQRIIAARPFQSADELRKVKGIGEMKFSQLRPYFQ